MKTPEEERAARLAAEAREEAERLERLRSEVKGREYTYDQEECDRSSRRSTQSGCQPISTRPALAWRTSLCRRL